MAVPSFLNPANLAPELQNLGNLYKITPISGQSFSLPASIFVSAGRFAAYLIVAFIMLLGTAAYLLLSHWRRGRTIVFGSIAMLAVASLLCGARGTVILNISSAAVLLIGVCWGAPNRKHEAHRLNRAIRRSVIFAGLGPASPSRAISRRPDIAGFVRVKISRCHRRGGEKDDHHKRDPCCPMQAAISLREVGRTHAGIRILREH